jgi:CHAT domain-containing protein|tara:strand:- start:132 stop:422 length:291 start_codon:yes stop_codon:yes gene_type:complete
METTKINTDNEWITVVDKKKVKKDKRRMKKKLLKEQQNKKQNNRNNRYYDNSKKLYQKNIKPEIKTIQNAPETTDKKPGIAILTNAFSSLLNEFDE